MNLTDAKYKDFALVKEMLETPEVLRAFDYNQVGDLFDAMKGVGRVFLTGEGSSRIFPAKNFMCEIMKLGGPVAVSTDGARQAHEYGLEDFVVVGASNSGQTKELVSLFTKLTDAGHQQCYGLTANANTKLESLAKKTWVLKCGKEDAVAATKSVVEQALFYQAVAAAFAEGRKADVTANQEEAADASREVLEMELDPAIVQAIANAPTIYFAGRNNGVAEELTLKTNEITRKKSDFLEGTYAVHGIEEVMDGEDVAIIVDPFEAEAEKFKQVLVDGVGMKVFAISSRETIFPTIQIPRVWGYDTMLQLQAGWNVLVSVGVTLGIDLDKPVRARKVGNEFMG